MSETVKLERALRSRAAKLFCLAVVLLGLSLALTLPEPVAALPANMVMEFYYSDPGFTNQVGWRTVLRCGGTSGPLFGQVGPYCIQEDSSCQTGGGGGWSSRECFIYEWTPCGNGNQCVTNFWNVSCPP